MIFKAARGKKINEPQRTIKESNNFGDTFRVGSSYKKREFLNLTGSKPATLLESYRRTITPALLCRIEVYDKKTQSIQE